VHIAKGRAQEIFTFSLVLTLLIGNHNVRKMVE